jgi:23S rRNA pseudouridine1911/1915/1917 synthase
MYGSTDTRIQRAALHCGILDFVHPVTKETMHFEVPPPDDMTELINIIYSDNR